MKACTIRDARAHDHNVVSCWVKCHGYRGLAITWHGTVEWQLYVDDVATRNFFWFKWITFEADKTHVHGCAEITIISGNGNNSQERILVISWCKHDSGAGDKTTGRRCTKKMNKGRVHVRSCRGIETVHESRVGTWNCNKVSVRRG